MPDLNGMKSSDPLADPTAKIAAIGSQKDMVEFLTALRNDLALHREDWQNWTLEDYLESMETWLREMGDQVLEQPLEPAAWRAMAWLLWGGRVYE